jgi:hypothetical protein
MSWGTGESQDSNGSDPNASASIDSQFNSFALASFRLERTPGLPQKLSGIAYSKSKWEFPLCFWLTQSQDISPDRIHRALLCPPKAEITGLAGSLGER